MFIKTSNHEITCVKTSQFPQNSFWDITFVGKSNVGKSSTINLLLGRKKLAYVGNTPGKTRVINFYNVNEELYFVDLPGYGFSNVSKNESASWGRMIEGYLLERQKSKLILFLIDIRHKPGKNDIMMHEWIKHYEFPYAIVATKADKISAREREINIDQIRETLEIGEEIKIIPVSASKKTGKEELWEVIDTYLECD
jgi:GTP-binding protein